MTTTLLTGCIPSDQKIAAGSSTTSEIVYAGFTGLEKAETIGATKVKLSWTESTDANVVAYTVYDTSNMFSPVVIRTVTAPASGVTLTSLTTQKYYSFRVRAATANNTEDTNTKNISAIPYAGATSAVVTSSTSAKINFTDGSNADEIQVLCTNNFDSNEKVMAHVTDVTKTFADISGLVSSYVYSCRAALSIGGFLDNNTVMMTFVPMGQATKLTFTTQPSSSAVATVLPIQPVVRVEDAAGNVIASGPDATANITLTFATASPTGGAISGTATVTAVAGVATFSGLSFNDAGNKIITATKSDTSGQNYGTASFAVNSDQFTITSGSIDAAQSTLAVSVLSPGGATPPLAANGSDTYTVKITLKDQYGNFVAGVKPQFASNIPGDVLTQPTANTNANGETTGTISTTVADYSSSVLLRSLSISSPTGLSTVAAPAVFQAGPAAKMSFSQQPPTSTGAGTGGIGQVKVEVQDTYGNVVNNSPTVVDTNLINLYNNNGQNGAILSGVISAMPNLGVATFTDLGLDKTGTGYKIQAVYGGSVPNLLSNSFNITAGTPVKIAVTGPATITSGTCSTTAFKAELQDGGNNPAKPSSTTTITLDATALSGALAYTTAGCGGASVTTLSIATNASSKLFYLKNNKAESISVNATGTALTAGSLAVGSSAKNISLTSATSSIVSGACAPLTVTTKGADNIAGPLFVATTLNMSGLLSVAKVYSASDCNAGSLLTATSIPLAVNTVSPYTSTIYIKDDKAENLTLNLIDTASVLQPGVNLALTVTASNIDLAGASSILAGACSIYTIKIKDAQGTDSTASSNIAMNINGLSGKLGVFYASAPDCAGGTNPLTASVTFPSGQSVIQYYFKDNKAEAMNLYLSAASFVNSQTINLGVSPNIISITAPAGNLTSVDTDICVGPFLIQTNDATPAVAAVVSAITVNLSGVGTGGSFYAAADTTCSGAAVTSLSFGIGESSKSVYFMSHWPVSGLILTATDQAAALTAGTLNYNVIAKPSWIGSAGTDNADSFGNMPSWFRTGADVARPEDSRIDGVGGAGAIHIQTDGLGNKFLYLWDQRNSKIVKYDYSNKKYLGWIGWYSPSIGATISGSNVAAPTTADCQQLNANMNVGKMTPGWCKGGISQSLGDRGAIGGFWGDANPYAGPNGDITSDSTYIYVTNLYTYTVQRFNAETGAFAGWIGTIYSATTPSGYDFQPNVTSTITDAAGGAGGCGGASLNGPTPGWCLGGQNTKTNWSDTPTTVAGDGKLNWTTGIVNDSTYLYVATRGAINRYHKTNGSFQGWIGRVASTTGISNAAGNPGDCSAGVNIQAPGWCSGGSYNYNNTYSLLQTGTFGNAIRDLLIVGNTLYVLQRTSGGLLTAFNKDTGAFIKNVVPGAPTSSLGWNNPYSMTTDGTVIFVADDRRIIKVSAANGSYLGWIGKLVSNSSSYSMTNADGVGNECENLPAGAITPVWCLNGYTNVKPGLEENALAKLMGITFDGTNLLVVQNQNYSAIKRYVASTGAYEGTLAMTSLAPVAWKNSVESKNDLKLRNAPSGGRNDNSLYSPTGGYIDAGYLYVADSANARIKKIDITTGQTVGWIGGIASLPTGGYSGAACTGGGILIGGASPGWCLGAMPLTRGFDPWTYGWSTIATNTMVNGLMLLPVGITGDGTYLYVTDRDLHRILKFKISDGSYQGWVGGIGSNATIGSTDPANDGKSNQATLGWSKGGSQISGLGDGYLWGPVGIVYLGGNLYVVDSYNNRVVSFDAATGVFNGWIGRVASATGLTGCTTVERGGSGYLVSQTGWCKGGTTWNINNMASMTGWEQDQGGSFVFYGKGVIDATRAGITTDNTNLYIANPVYSRIDKINPDGSFISSVRAAIEVDSGWKVTGTINFSFYNTDNYNARVPRAIWTDGTNLYGTYNWGGNQIVFKRDLATGNFVGWRGAIANGGSPTAGVCAGATDTTPDWCKTGVAVNASVYNPDGFNNPYGITGDTKFIYVMDEAQSRVHRLPK